MIKVIKNSMFVLVIVCLTFAILSAATSGQTKPTREKPIWSGESGGFKISWTEDNIVALDSQGKLVFSAKRLAENSWKEISRDDPDAATKFEYNEDYRLLSVVGSIISYEHGVYCACGGVHPSANTSFVALDLAHPGAIVFGYSDLNKNSKTAKLNEIFNENDIFLALSADSFVKKALQAGDQEKPKNLNQLVKSIAYQSVDVGDCVFGAYEDMLTRFAFHHIENGKVAVRLGISHSAEVCRGLNTQIGILLPIPEKLKNDLALAESGKAGFLMKDQSKIAKDRSTHFSFGLSD